MKRDCGRFYLWVEIEPNELHQTGRCDGYESFEELEKENEYYFNRQSDGFKRVKVVTRSKVYMVFN
jgi:hypothetical protein